MVATGGVALIEFALTLPLLLIIGAYGTELAVLAMANLRVSQLALNLADTASRVGATTGNVTQLREVDINDVFAGVRVAAGNMPLSANGRVTLSSLENVQQSYDDAPKQRIHWQRCFGLKAGDGHDSSYGTTKPTDGTDDTAGNAGTLAPDGMGEANAKATAPTNSGVMFVEINYSYTPLFGGVFVKPRTIRYTASLLVRDNRDFTQVYNPSDSSGPRSTCDKHTG